MNQLMDSNQEVSFGAVLLSMHRHGSNQHLTFLDPQQPHSTEFHLLQESFTETNTFLLSETCLSKY